MGVERPADEADAGGVPELSSPACSMREAGDVYMGYAGRDEVVAFLNELLEAERAGARVALESARTAGAPADLLLAIQRDEARWCAMLHGHIGALGENPSPHTGAFLNRGQGWVVRKLREMLPRVRDDRLGADLSAMLRSHEANIALASTIEFGDADRD